MTFQKFREFLEAINEEGVDEDEDREEYNKLRDPTSRRIHKNVFILMWVNRSKDGNLLMWDDIEAEHQAFVETEIDPHMKDV